MIDTMASAAMRRVAEPIKHFEGRRVMRELAEEYARKDGLAPVEYAQAAINTVAPTARELIYTVAEKYNTDPATAAQWLIEAAGEIANFEG